MHTARAWRNVNTWALRAWCRTAFARQSRTVHKLFTQQSVHTETQTQTQLPSSPGAAESEHERERACRN